MPRRMTNAFALFEGKLNLYLLQGVPNRIFMKPTSTWQVDIGELSQDWVVYFLNIRKASSDFKAIRNHTGAAAARGYHKNFSLKQSPPLTSCEAR